MYKFVAFFGLLLLDFSLIAQNVGVGTTSPKAKLDVLNSIRIGGPRTSSSYISYDSLSGKFIWNNSYLYIPSNQAIIKHSTLQEGLYYNNQQLEYRNQSGNPVFASNWNTGNAYFTGYVGIGIGVTAPTAPLHFPNTLGDRIILWGDDLNNNFGIGIQSYQLQIHTYGTNTDIAFGYGNSNDFHENFRVKASGGAGIGAEGMSLESSLDVRKGYNNAAAYIRGSENISHFNFGPQDFAYLRGGITNAKVILNDIPGGKTGIGVDPVIGDGVLELGGRMRIRSGGGPYFAGTWLNKTDNSGLAAFVGMENDNYVGFYGISAGWKFCMNTQSGTWKLNGSEGTAGNILQSNGSAAAPSWVSPSNAEYNNTLITTSTMPITTGDATPPTDIPGLSGQVNVTGNAKVLVTYNVYAQTNSCNFCGNSFAYIDILLDGLIVSQNVHDIGNGRETQLTGVYLVPVTSGNHVIKLTGRSNGPFVTFSCSSCSYGRRMVLEIIPQ